MSAIYWSSIHCLQKNTSHTLTTFTGKGLSNALQSVRNTLSSGIKITCQQLSPETDLVHSDIRIFKS